MANGLKSYVEKTTPTSLERDCVDNFIKHCKENNIHPEPYQAEKMLLSQIRSEISTRNNTADKTDQWSKPVRLSPTQIAKCMIAFDHVRLVAFADGSFSHENDELALYQPDGKAQGLYSADRDILTRRILEYSESIRAREVEDVIRMLRALAPKVSRTQEKNLIAVNNGLFNYVTKQLEPFTPDHVFFSKLVTDYNPNAQNVQITMPDGKVWDCEWQLDSLTDDPEMRKFLRQVISAMCRPHVDWNKAILAYSTKGNNGKGTLAAIMRAIMGPDAHASIPLKDFGKDFMLEPLMHTQGIIVDENDVGAYIDSSANFKNVVTHDIIPINRKYKNPVNVQYWGLVYQCINEFPRVHDRSESYLRRVIIVPFDKNFEGEERTYIKSDYIQRKEVREYYLKCALESEFYEFDIPQVCLDAKQLYSTYNDPLRDFFENIVDHLVWKKQPLSWLYDLYKQWYAVNHPSGTVMPSSKFRLDIVQMAIDSGKWTCPGIQKVVAINPGDMSGYEEAIMEYNVTNYMNPNYKGVDWEKRCNFKRPKTVRGCLIRIQDPSPDRQKYKAVNDEHEYESDNTALDTPVNDVPTTTINNSVEDIPVVPTTAVITAHNAAMSADEREEIMRQMHEEDLKTIYQNQLKPNQNNKSFYESRNDSQSIDALDIEDIEPNDVLPINFDGTPPYDGTRVRDTLEQREHTPSSMIYTDNDYYDNENDYVQENPTENDQSYDIGW